MAILGSGERGQGYPAPVKAGRIGNVSQDLDPAAATSSASTLVASQLRQLRLVTGRVANIFRRGYASNGAKLAS
jgi:hypothetical protein